MARLGSDGRRLLVPVGEGRAPRAAAAPGPRSDRQEEEEPALKVILRDATELIPARRGRLALGFGLAPVSRLCGLVLPGTTKILLDDVIGKGRRELLLPIVLAAGGGDPHPGHHRLRPLPGPRQGRPALDHRDAARGPAPRRPPPGRLLRPDEDGRPPLPRHDRRRGDPQPRRHGPRRARRGPADGPARPRNPLLLQRQADADRPRRSSRSSASSSSTRSRRCGRSSASARRSTPRSPAG